MISVSVGGSPDLARQGQARHKLFVEGSEDDVIDAEALKVLLSMIDIETMGPSFHLKSVATALHPHHADYYFLIDRDHYDDQAVNDSWQNFPDTSKSNLLIWRKKEFENYFIDPNYLQKSKWIKNAYKGEQGRTKLEQKILSFANHRFFLEVVNRVILKIRGEQNNTWIAAFTNPDEFGDKETAKATLLNLTSFQQRKQDVENSVDHNNLVQLFDHFYNEMSGGYFPLSFNHGRWIDHMSGKEILTQTINNCFQVKDTEGNIVQKDKHIEVIKDLMRLDLALQPMDFQELYNLINMRTQEP